MADLDSLLTTPPQDLIRNLTELRAERALIEDKESLLVQILDLLSKQGGEVAEEVAALGGASGFGPIREQIRQVLISAKNDEPLMLPKDVHRELLNRGNRNTTLDNIRTTMKRMADDGELVRPDPESVAYGLPDIPDALLAMARDMNVDRSQPK